MQLPGLIPLTCSTCFLILSRTISPGVTLPPVSWAFPYQSFNWLKSRWRPFLIWVSSSPICLDLAKTNQYTGVFHSKVQKTPKNGWTGKFIATKNGNNKKSLHKSRGWVTKVELWPLTMEYCLAMKRNVGGLMMPFGSVMGTLSQVKETSQKWPHIVRFHLCKMSLLGKSIETESRSVLGEE